MKQRRCRTIDIVKLIMTLWVALMHFESFYFKSDSPIFSGGYLAVDFFFVLSGYLLYASYASGRYKNAYVFTYKRIFNFLPYVFINFIAINILVTMETIRTTSLDAVGLWDFLIKKVLLGINEMINIQMFIPAENTNFPVWYVSVMIFVGLGYYCYLENKKSRHFGGLLLFAIVVMSYLSGQYHNLDVNIGDSTILILRSGVIRGIAGMGLGLFCAGTFGGQEIKGRKWIIIAIINVCLLFLIMARYSRSDIDFVFLLLSASFITICFNAETVIDRFGKLPDSVDMLSKNIYFDHLLVVLLWNYLRRSIGPVNDLGMLGAIVLFFVMLVLMSAITEMIARLLRSLFDRMHNWML